MNGAHTFEDLGFYKAVAGLVRLVGVLKHAEMARDEWLEEIKKCTKAGTGCGTCIRTGPQPKLLAHTLNAKGVSTGVCKSLPFEADDIEDLAKARQLKSLEGIENWPVASDSRPFLVWHS